MLSDKEKQEIREVMANQEHIRWAKWQKYLHSKLQYEERNFGSHKVAYYLLDAGLYEHWSRQIDTDYSELSEKEKDSDREQVEPYLSIIEERVDKILNEPMTKEHYDNMVGKAVKEKLESVEKGVEELPKVFVDDIYKGANLVRYTDVLGIIHKHKGE